MKINIKIILVHKNKEAIVPKFLYRTKRHQKINKKVIKGLIKKVLLVKSKNFKKMIRKHGPQTNYIERSLLIKKSVVNHLKILFLQDKFCNNKLKK